VTLLISGFDGTHIKAHQHSGGGNENLQSISKSVAGRATKIHLAVDAHGNPITFILSDGTTHDVKVAPDLVDKVNLSNTVDKNFDASASRSFFYLTFGIALHVLI